MSTIFERRDYKNRVFVVKECAYQYQSRAGVDVIPIRFHWWKVCGKFNPDTRRHDLEEKVLLRRTTLELRFSREKVCENAKTKMERFAKYKRLIDGSPREANKLRNKLRRYVRNEVGLSLDDYPLLIEQILIVLQEQAVPNQNIEVQAINYIYRYTEEGLSTLYDMDDEQYHRAKLIPANESFIQALEEASPPADDDELECAICMEMFEKQKADTSITQLPCSHYYHRDCIVPWLHINHVCPTCRRPYAPSR